MLRSYHRIVAVIIVIFWRSPKKTLLSEGNLLLLNTRKSVLNCSERFKQSSPRVVLRNTVERPERLFLVKDFVI